MILNTLLFMMRSEVVLKVLQTLFDSKFLGQVKGKIQIPREAELEAQPIPPARGQNQQVNSNIYTSFNIVMMNKLVVARSDSPSNNKSSKNNSNPGHILAQNNIPCLSNQIQLTKLQGVLGEKSQVKKSQISA